MSVEKQIKAKSGWGMLAAVSIALIAIIAVFVGSIVGMASTPENETNPLLVILLVASIILFVAWFVPVCGFFALQPGQARVCILFGDYKGTVRDEGFLWANPFYSRSMGTNSAAEDAVASAVSKSGLSLSKSIETAAKAASGLSTKVSIRARTLNGEVLKVNDKVGNPIEIANVVVWHVEDTAKALFDVDNYEQFVATQAETALRHVASVRVRPHGGHLGFQQLHHPAFQHRGGLRGPAPRALAAPGAGGRRRGRRAPHPPRLRTGDRPGHAAPPAGRGRHRRAQEDRRGRRLHG